MRPVKRSCASAAKTSSESAPARRMLAISSASLTARSDSTSPTHRDDLDPGLDERPVPLVGQVLLLERDPPPGEVGADRGKEVARGLDEADALDLARPRAYRKSVKIVAVASGSTSTAALELERPVR